MLDNPRAAVAAAREVGVRQMVTIGIDLDTSRTAIALADGMDGVYATVGLHPHDAGTFDDPLLDELVRLASAERVVAIGECGLDFYRDLSPRATQRRVFAAQIGVARLLSLPLVVHVRDAGEEALDMLAQEAEGLTVIMHCFSLPEHAEECARRGYYASFAGNLTYKNAAALRDAAAAMPADLLLLETDAPYLAPVPRRGRPNVPAWVAHTAKALAAVRGWSVEETAATTTANAARAFRLPPMD